MSRTLKIYNNPKSKLFVHKWWKERKVCTSPKGRCKRCLERWLERKKFRGWAWARKKDLINNRGIE